MTMTPESVRNKQFETVKLREGYNMGEVDLFLDEVEHELERLINENASLKARIEALRSDRPETAPGETASAKTEAAAPAANAPQTPVAEAAQNAATTVQTVSQASTAAVRILEKAAIGADELVSEAREQADKLTADARAEAERLTNEARGKASRLEADARTRADALNREVSARRVELFGKLEADREKLARDVDELRTFEREYRGRLKGYFNDQLKALDATPSHADEVAAGNHTRPDGEETPHLRALRDESS